MMVSGFYRWIRVKAIIKAGLSARMNHAPASETSCDEKIKVAEEAELYGRATAEVKLNSNIFAACVAGLVSYSRAAVVYVSKIFTRCSAVLSSAGSAIMASYKALKMVRISKASAADSVGVAIDTEIKAKNESVGAFAPAEHHAAETAFTEESTATANSADGQAVGLQSSFGAAHGAKMATWMEPYIENGILYIRQAYSAEVKNGVLEVR